MQDVEEHVTSVGAVKPEEEKVNKEIHDYIIDRLKEVKTEENQQRKSYKEVVTSYSSRVGNIEETMELISDNDTYK